MKLTLRHYEILKAVADAKNFTKAAQKLFLTQSAVSHAIKELEMESGTILFERLSKGVRITQSGKVLLDSVIPILSSCKEVEENLCFLERKSPIRIVSSITMAIFYLPDILKTFQADWPDCPVRVQVMPSTSAFELLKRGEVDLAFVEGAAPQSSFLCTPFGSYALVAACAPDYSFMGDKNRAKSLKSQEISLSLKEFCSENLLLREKGSAIRDTLDSFLLLSGLSAQPVWESVNSPALIEAAKAGLGITVLPELLLQEALLTKNLITLSIPELSLHNQIFLIRDKNHHETEALKAFLSYSAVCNCSTMLS